MPQALLGFIVGVCTLLFPFPLPALMHSMVVWMSALTGLLFGFGFYCFKNYKNNIIQSVDHFSYSSFILGIVYFFTSFVFGSSYAHWQLDRALQERLTQPVEKTALVRVVGLSDGVGDQWRQVVEEVTSSKTIKTPENKRPIRWLLYSQFDWKTQQKTTPPDMKPGQVWQINVKLKPAHSNASFGAFDVEKWLLQQHISAIGTLQRARQLTVLEQQQKLLVGDSLTQRFTNSLDHERLRIRQHIMQFDSPAKGVLLGLLTGDRSLIEAKTTLLYQQMGISHLLAISGPHVLLAALIITWLLQKLLDRFSFIYLIAERRRWLLPIFLLVVLLYAGLAGFDIPAQRTVLMVMVLAGLLWFRRHGSAFIILLLAASILLLLDPLVILSAAFWLSFGAVAILMNLKRPNKHTIVEDTSGQLLTTQPDTKLNQFKQSTLSFIHLQWRLFILLAPLVLLCFAKISWLAPIVNLLAIPLLSFIVLPLNLLAYALFLMSPTIADMVWQFALSILELFHVGLAQLSDWFPQALQPFYLNNIQLVALFAMLILLLLPKNILPKWWLIFLSLPALYPIRATAPLMVQVLDVGQGLSILLKTPHHAMLVDTGVKTPNGSDMGEKVVIPAIQAQGIKRLDKLMLTHLDNDHSGGAPTVLKQIPVTQLTSSEVFAPFATHLCEAGQSWQWDGVLFRVLAPLPQQHAVSNKQAQNKNESSCVLMVQTPATKEIPSQQVLITGDAGFYTEFLLQQQQNPIKADLLVLGHHGSKHSSSSLFLQGVAPQRAVVSAGYLNRYQHPAPIVLARLAEQNIAVDSTITGGTLTYYLGEKLRLEPSRYRDSKAWLKRMND